MPDTWCFEMGDEDEEEVAKAALDYRALQRKVRDLSNSVRNRSF